MVVIKIFSIAVMTLTVIACSSTGNDNAIDTQLDIISSSSITKNTQAQQLKDTVDKPKGKINETTESSATATPLPRTIRTSPTATATPLPVMVIPREDSIKIINYTKYATTDLENWIYLAESKMKSRRARIFLFIYPVGEMKKPEEPIRSDYADQVFRAHEVLLNQTDIESILDQVEDWFAGDPCLDTRDIKRNLSDYRSWLENGGDASTMHAVCEETRIVSMGVTKNMRFYEPLEAFQSFLIHEFYHAFQQDLEMEGECMDMRNRYERNSNSQWLVEGAAHYFATWLVAEINNTLNYESKILEIALRNYEREGENIGPDKWGAAALNLMVKQNLITEESILDGSFFHNCDRELVFNKNNPKIQKIKDSWNLIEKKGDTFKFKDLALK